MTIRRIFLLAMGLLGVAVAIRWGSVSQRLTPAEAWESGLRGIRAEDLVSIEQAITQLEKANQSGEPSDSLTLLRGARSLYLGETATALRCFAVLDPKGPHRDPLLVLTAQALYRSGQFLEAQLCLEQALADQPENLEALRWLAIVAYDRGDIPNTLLTLEQIAKLAPGDYRPLHMRGIIHRDFGEQALAIQDLTAALKQSPPLTLAQEIRMQIAASQMDIKQFEAARQTLKTCSESPEMLSLLADCCWQLGDASQSRELLAKLNTAGELPRTARRLNARMMIEENQLEPAQRLLESLTSTDPADDESEFLLAAIARRRQDEVGYRKHQDRSEAIKSLKNQLTELSQKAAQEPDNGEVREQLGAICEQLGMNALAQVWRTAAASLQRSSSLPRRSESMVPSRKLSAP